MHPLQSHILKELNLKEKARYAELKPHGIESNNFVYHLNRVIKDGFVSKSGPAYFLTAPGKRYVGRLSLKSFSPRLQPIIVTTIIIQDRRGNYLLMKSKRQPFLGKISFPYGKVHFGENILEAAHRELKEKTGLMAQLRHRGDMYLAIRERGELVAHMLCHVFEGSRSQGQIILETKTHSISWQALGSVNSKAFVPGVLEMHRLYSRSKDKFFAEKIV